MAKEITPRLPQPQQRITQTYSRPNPVAPQAPIQAVQPLAVNTETEAAGWRLAQSLSNFGLKIKDQQIDLAQQEEEIRVANLKDEEVEAALFEEARNAEAVGAITFGSGPHRIIAAQRALGRRLMRDQYIPMLEDNANKFTDPLNLDSDGQASQYALDAFRELGIQGHYAQVEATKIYNATSSRWLAGVRAKRQQNLEIKAEDDFHNELFVTFTDVLEGGDMESGFEDILLQNDGYYKTTGTSGHPIIQKALSDSLNNQLRELNAREDVEGLSVLLGIVGSMPKEVVSEALIDTSESLINAAISTLDRPLNATRQAERNNIIIRSLRVELEKRRANGEEIPENLHDEGAKPILDSVITALKEEGFSGNIDDLEFAENYQYRTLHSNIAQRSPQIPHETEQGLMTAFNGVETQTELNDLLDSTDPSYMTPKVVAHAQHKQRLLASKQQEQDNKRSTFKDLPGRRRAVASGDKFVTDISARLGVNEEVEKLIFDTHLNQLLFEVADGAYNRDNSQEQNKKNMGEAVSDATKALIQVFQYDENRKLTSLDLTLIEDLPIPVEFKEYLEEINKDLANEKASEIEVDEAVSQELSGAVSTSEILSAPVYTQRAMMENREQRRRDEEVSFNNLLKSVYPSAQAMIDSVPADAAGPFVLGSRLIISEDKNRVQVRSIHSEPHRFGRGSSPRRYIIRENPQETENYYKAMRQGGIFPEDMEKNEAYGMSLSADPKFKSPVTTLYLNKETYSTDLKTLVQRNNELESENRVEEKDLIDDPSLENNEIIKAYKAWRAWDNAHALTFDKWLEYQLKNEYLPISPEVVVLINELK